MIDLLPPSPFISDSADVVMPSVDTAVASTHPAGVTAVPDSALEPAMAADAAAAPDLTDPPVAAAVQFPQPAKAGEASTAERALCDASGMTRASRTGCCEVGCGQAPEFFAESSTATGGIQEAPAVELPPSDTAGVLDDEHRFVLDEAALAAELADETVRQELAMRMPTFLSAPSQEYLRAIA